MIPDPLRYKKQQIETLAHQFGAERIRVFGSVARGEEQESSDIDFLVKKRHVLSEAVEL